MIKISDIHHHIFEFLMESRRYNPSLFFILRQLNRNSRLEKGYWFLGNDNYITLSFWMGKDTDTKLPRVSFVINIDGTTFLEIKKDIKYNNFFTHNFFSEIGIINKSSGDVERKYYTDFKTDYMKSLKSFIEKDKVIIDNFIKKNNQIDNHPLANGGIDFIWPESFERQLRIIDKYQKIRIEKEKNTGYLRNFNIRKFGNIRQLKIKDIPSDCRWIFLTGENGAGKTTILRALATAMTNNNDNGIMVAKNYPDFNVQIGLGTINGVNKITIKGHEDFKNKNILVKGLATYGPVRLISQSSIREQYVELDKNNISDLTTFGLFNPIGVLRDISSSYVLNVKPKYYEMTLKDFTDNIKQNLSIILPNIEKVSFVSKQEGTRIIYYQKGHNKKLFQKGVEFEQLPSGTKSLAALILDLLLRFAEQQNVSDISDYSGIVLIDEIDIHLHPKMQKEIVIQLSETFPNIQFIVTTHSPIPILGAPLNSIFINVYRDSENKICASKLDIDISSLLPNTILTSPIFNFHELISENHNQEERLVTEEDYSEALFYRILERKIRERDLNPPT
ncbi:hypothetical protein EG344_23885 [Chryseobacterium sp. G0162]|uniref:AAA family ATPase n=1 Tax=Chryseobacterium sp. G0162 TaxID=2487063 RepID=UPI000F4EB1E6|nr:AAA family ATPase [Chryseobacterium sp. G0162]AZB11650.1 hypothetical protein EG344_23885 [Chryseobacterium sp. G0162]